MLYSKVIELTSTVMSVFRRLLRNSIDFVDKCLGLRKLMRPELPTRHPLAGDRAIEWSWVVKNLPIGTCQILDFGCTGSVLSGIASRLGHDVTSVDLNDIEYEMHNVRFRKGDINTLDFGGDRFDVIMNCSTVEHVGLENRYGSEQATDGDFLAMRKLRELLAYEGRMILTIPVGLDAVIKPFHRVYGVERLPELLLGYRVLQQEFWTRGDNRSLWHQCDKATALLTRGSDDYYALGLFVLASDRQ